MLTLSPVLWRTLPGQALVSRELMWTKGAVILRVMSVSVTTLTRSLDMISYHHFTLKVIDNYFTPVLQPPYEHV